jgi:hypothetical protein
MWPRDSLYDILVTHVAAFCSCLKSLHEAKAKMKRIKLIALTKKDSENPSIFFVLWCTIIKTILIKLRKLREKRVLGSKMELNLVFEEIKRLRKW